MRRRYQIDMLCMVVFLATSSVLYVPQVRNVANRASIVWGSLVRRGA